MVEKKTTAKKTAGKATPKAPTKAVAPVAEKPRKMLPHEFLTSPNWQNAIGVFSWGKFAGEADLGELATNLSEEVKTVLDGNMRPAEAMLYGQAMTLQTIFTNLARRASTNDGLKQFQVNLTLALKAQAQCRATLEALAEIKNPRPVQFVKQANMTTGPQQVNNGYASASGHTGISTQAATHSSHAENSQSEPNKLLEADHGERLDTRAQTAAGRAGQTVAGGVTSKTKRPL